MYFNVEIWLKMYVNAKTSLFIFHNALLAFFVCFCRATLPILLHTHFLPFPMKEQQSVTTFLFVYMCVTFLHGLYINLILNVIFIL